ncbi:MAG: hypothetical protein ACRD1U_16480 [Vicinamibacterales bacterium]
MAAFFVVLVVAVLVAARIRGDRGREPGSPLERLNQVVASGFSRKNSPAEDRAGAAHFRL